MPEGKSQGNYQYNYETKGKKICFKKVMKNKTNENYYDKEKNMIKKV